MAEDDLQTDIYALWQHYLAWDQASSYLYTARSTHFTKNISLGSLPVEKRAQRYTKNILLEAVLSWEKQQTVPNLDVLSKLVHETSLDGKERSWYVYPHSHRMLRRLVEVLEHPERGAKLNAFGKVALMVIEEILEKQPDEPLNVDDVLFLLDQLVNSKLVVPSSSEIPTFQVTLDLDIYFNKPALSSKEWAEKQNFISRKLGLVGYKCHTRVEEAFQEELHPRWWSSTRLLAPMRALRKSLSTGDLSRQS